MVTSALVLGGSVFGLLAATPASAAPKGAGVLNGTMSHLNKTQHTFTDTGQDQSTYKIVTRKISYNANTTFSIDGTPVGPSKLKNGEKTTSVVGHVYGSTIRATIIILGGS